MKITKSLPFGKQFLLNFLGIIIFSSFIGVSAQQHTISSFNPTSQIAGNTVVITGTNFSSITSVKFGGVNASSFTVNSATQITATVPVSAANGDVTVAKTSQTDASSNGFVIVKKTTSVYTDFGGYWNSSEGSNNVTIPNLNHNLLAFTYDGTVYSTGVSDATLTSNSVTFNAGQWLAFPVNTIGGNGTTAAIAISAADDGNATTAINPNKKIQEVLIDGIQGLGIGTGVIDFGANTSGLTLEFQVASVDTNKINDAIPDILFTQVANPVNTNRDRIKFVDINGNTVGQEITVNVFDMPQLGTLNYDMWYLNSRTTPAILNNDAVTSSLVTDGQNTTRPLRLFALKLKDFGITSANYDDIEELILTPGGRADYAFISYNNGSITIPAAEITQQPQSQMLCQTSGQSTQFSVTNTTPSGGGTVTYQWQKNGIDLTNTGNISGATSSTLSISNITPADYGSYTVELTNLYGSVLSNPAYLNLYFTLQPTSSALCINATAPVKTIATGGAPSPTVQWYSNTSNTATGATLISGANTTSYTTPTSTAGTTYYFAIISTVGPGNCPISDTSDIISVVISPATVAGTVSGATTVCYGTNSTTLTLSGNTGSVTSWQSSATAGFSSPTTIANTTSSLTATNLTSDLYYRPVVQSGTCASASPSAAQIIVNLTYTWEGDNSSVYNVPGNWIEGCVPHTGANISFRTVTDPDNRCVLNVDPILGNITIGGTSATHIFDLNNRNLTVQGNLILSGTNIDAKDGSSNLIMAGASAQSIPAGAFVDFEVAKLTINNSTGVTLNGRTDLTRLLTMTAGTLNTGGYLTFKSNVNFTAMMASFPASGAAINGNVIIEKYVPAKRAFRMVSPTVTTTSTIKENWQENGSSWSNNPNPGFGTHITGSQAGANGLDATITGQPSLFTFNNQTQAWGNIANTNVLTLNAGTPYRLMIRGDRSVNIYQSDNNPTPTNTTIRTTGTIHTGSFNVTDLNSSANSDNFVGNPYQCAVDLSTIVNSSNLNTTYVYMWDPFLNVRGAYGTVTLSNNTVSPMASTASKYLQPGQAFFVKTSSSPSGSPTLTFTEASKYTGSNSTTNLWEVAVSEYDFVDVTLINKDSGVVADGTQVKFSPTFDNKITDLDAPKAWNLDEVLTINRNGKKLAIEARNMPNETDMAPLYVTNYRSTNYTFRINVNGLKQHDVYLKDNVKNTLTKLSSGNETEYNFNVSMANGKDTGRFAIVMMSNLALTQTASINSNSIETASVYPNPFDGQQFQIANIGWEINKINVDVMDATGRVIESQKLNRNNTSNFQVAVKHPLTSGSYFLRIATEKGSFTMPIFKN